METTEGNKLIAEFMGYQILRKKFETQQMCSSNETTWVMDEDDIVCDAKGNEVDDERQEPYYYLESLPFNYSWDWLMPVLLKITTIETDKIYHVDWALSCSSISITAYDPKANYKNFTKGSENPDYQIKFTFDAVVDFIEWYNEQNK